MLTRDQYSYSTCSSVDNGSFGDLEQVSPEYTTAGIALIVCVFYIQEKSGNNSIE